ncbi:MAG: nucleotide sugar dehydrogenase [Planctomycetota bacterium]|nr:nucleotide sugar dehydrogenase [Planctomycetota bacterium]
MADVCVLGLGYVGLPTASLLANSGMAVLGVDIDEEVVTSLRSLKIRLGGAGLSSMVKAAIDSGNLKTSTAPERSEVFVLCVPTPVRPEGVVDLGAVEAATRSILPILKRGNLILLESTSPIGTTRGVVGRILAESGLVPGEDFDLCYCPERVLPGKTIGELINNDRILGGVTAASAQRARRVYERFTEGEILLTDDRTAEMVKLIENTYRDTNIALANSFARIAEDAGVDVWEAIALANRHPRVQIHDPGPGVGGHCLPVDPLFLAERFPDHAAMLRVAREINDGQTARILGRLRETGKLQPGDRLAILGAAYKEDIDDPRGSPAVRLAREAREAGLEVAIHDPLVKAESLDGFEVSRDLEAALKGAAATVLITPHAAYHTLSPEVFARCMSGRLIGDARNCLDAVAFRQAGFEVIVTGVGK